MKRWYELTLWEACFIGVWLSIQWTLFGWPQGWEWSAAIPGVAMGFLFVKWLSARHPLRRRR